MPSRYGGVIGGEGNCCASAVKTVELDVGEGEGYYPWKLMVTSSNMLVSRKLQRTPRIE